MKNLFCRSIICIITLCLVTFTLYACSDNEAIKQEASKQSNENPSSVLKTDRVNIQYAQWSVAATGLVEEKIKEFNDADKNNVYISLLNIPLDRYMETLNLMNASGTGPDVYEIMKEWLNSYIIKDWVADISENIDNDFLKGYPNWAKEAAQDTIDNKGEFYSLPSNQITYRLIYNKDLFKEVGLNPEFPPQTLSELEKYAKLISDAEKGKRKYGIAMPMGETWMSFVQPMEAMNCYSGVYYYDFKNGKYDLTVYNPWLKAIKNLNENGGLFPGMDTMKSNQAMAQFAEGNIGMMYASSWEVSLLLKEFTTKCDWGVALPPTLDESGISKGKIKIDTAGWNVIKSNSKHLEEALEVWEFLYSKDYLNGLFENSSMIPIMNNIIPAAGVSVENFNAFLPGKEDSVYPNTPLTMEEWARKNLYLSAVIKNQKEPILLEESNRLNSLLSTYTSSKFINYDDFYFPNFSPQNPLMKNNK